MVVLNAIIALSLTITLTYTVFYSMSKIQQRQLETADLFFRLLMIYTIVVIFLAAELYPYPIRFGEITLFLLLTIITAIVLGVVLILAVIPAGDTLMPWVTWLTASYLLLILFVDFFFITTHVRTFWVPFFIILAVLAVVCILHFFNIPQRFYGYIRILELYFQSYFFIALVSLVLLLQISLSIAQMFKEDDELTSRSSDNSQQLGLVSVTDAKPASSGTKI